MKALLAEVKSRFGSSSTGRIIIDHLLSGVNFENESELDPSEISQVLGVSSYLVKQNIEMTKSFKNNQNHNLRNQSLRSFVNHYNFYELLCNQRWYN